MRPIRTSQTNMIYKGPAAHIGDLPCSRQDVMGDGTSIADATAIFAVYEPTPEERRRIANGANLELGIHYMEPIPPVSLTVTDLKEVHDGS